MWLHAFGLRDGPRGAAEEAGIYSEEALPFECPNPETKTSLDCQSHWEDEATPPLGLDHLKNLARVSGIFRTAGEGGPGFLYFIFLKMTFFLVPFEQRLPIRTRRN